jgi:hypothetical protein
MKNKVLLGFNFLIKDRISSKVEFVFNSLFACGRRHKVQRVFSGAEEDPRISMYTFMRDKTFMKNCFSQCNLPKLITNHFKQILLRS